MKKTYRNNKNSNYKGNNYSKSNNNNQKRISRAPYNFIPLPDEIVKFERPDGHLSGYVDITLETKTPFFIRGNGSDFFKINDTPVIPGSTLRGMLKTLIEIMSFGKFHNVDNNTFFKRRVYNPKIKFRYGFLKKEGNNFIIYECSKGVKQLNDVRCNMDNKTKVCPDCNNGKEVKGSCPKEFDYREIDDLIFTTGKFGRIIRKWSFSKPSQKNFKILKELQLYKDYKVDITRNEKTPNVFDAAFNEEVKKVDIKNTGMPVFFTINSNNEVDYISHCKLGRTRFNKSVEDHIYPKTLLNRPIKSDFVDCIFGNTNFRGKIAIEDASLEEKHKKNYYLEKGGKFLPKILSSPKPTSTQMYLEPIRNKASNWDGSTNIRGYKLYWHKQTHNKGYYSWNEKANIRKTNSHTNFIEPLKPKLVFEGKIRFEKMTKEELGALLTVLELKDNMTHKLGLGKPLGLGSIKISPKLFITDKKSRFEKLVDDSGDWVLGEEEENISTYTKAFQKYILENISAKDKKEVNEYWDIPRIKELKTLLNFSVVENKNWLKYTSYMELKEFKFIKTPLPKPSEVSTKNN